MKYLFLFCTIFFIGLLSHGQSLNDLKTREQRTREQIKYINRLINETRQNEKYGLNKLSLLTEEIKLRNELIEFYSGEIKILGGFIKENQFVVSSLNSDLENIKKEYADMIRFAQKNKNSYDKILFLLSSEDFNQAYKRMMYLQQYADYRKKQADLIVDIKDLLELKTKDLERKKQQQQQLLVQKKEEADELEKQREEQNQQIVSLKKKEKDLWKQLRDQQRLKDKIGKEIERVIAEEERKAREKGVSGFMLTPEQKLISDQLASNKGRLPWPVERGVITEKFGVHPHPVLKTIQVKSNGIDISTTAGTKVRAVFNGEISKVFGISGGNMAIIIRHGNYLSVYSNLKEVFVKAGDKIKTKQELGTIYTDTNEENNTILKFQIWKESQKLNPEDWLSK